MPFEQFKTRVRRQRDLTGDHAGAFTGVESSSAPKQQLGSNASVTLVPVWRDVLLDTDTPVSAFAKLRRGPFAFLLESAPAGKETWARYTFMGTEPRGAWRLNDGLVEDWSPELGWHNGRRPADPLADLADRMAREYPVDAPELGAFWSGAVGFFGYDIVRLIESLPNPPKRGLNVPDALFVFTRSLVIIDNLRAQARVVITVPVPEGTSDEELRLLYDSASTELDEIVGRLHTQSPLPPLTLDPNAQPVTGESTIAKDDFVAGVERIKEYIRAGDCFQALLARRIDVPLDFSTESLYRTLRALNPSPYMYHLILDGVELVGSSPELLVQLADQRVTVRPIAGTRKRGATPEEDEALRKELLSDEKERAEHVMLVDLGRNDVGRIAEYGSVNVSEFMCVEQYSHVLHIVSQVDGQVRNDASAIDVFKAVFPAGTMTGAPKVRAMEIIDELEPQRRGPYAGALGYIASGGKRMDLAITIRTCVIADGVASIQAGAGIVADSVPELEWKETENKARAMLSAIGQARSATRGG
jgi:anthranilate synthase component 1